MLQIRIFTRIPRIPCQCFLGANSDHIYLYIDVGRDDANYDLSFEDQPPWEQKGVVDSGSLLPLQVCNSHAWFCPMDAVSTVPMPKIILELSLNQTNLHSSAYTSYSLIQNRYTEKSNYSDPLYLHMVSA